MIQSYRSTHAAIFWVLSTIISTRTVKGLSVICLVGRKELSGHTKAYKSKKRMELK